MYILEDRNLGFIAHPKTASSATQRVMREMGAKLFGDHHAAREEWCRPILDSGGLIMTTIRNPFDLLVSWYFHYKPRRGTQHMEPFKEWLPQQLANPNHYIRQGLFYGLAWANRVIRFERLQEDFNAVMVDVGLEPVPIKPLNVSRERKGVSYQEMYTTELIELVYDKYGDVIKNLGYSYGATHGP